MASPAEATPRSSASRCAAGDRVRTCTSAPSASATWAVEVGRRAEAVDAQPTAGRQLRTPQRPPADDAGAQQRRQFGVRVAVRQAVGEVGRRDGVLGVPAVGVPARVARVRAEVLGPAPAVPALPAGVAQPGDAGQITLGPAGHAGADRGHLPDDLVAGHDLRPVRREVTLDHVQVGAADRAGPHPQPESRPGRAPARAGAPGAAAPVAIGPGCSTLQASMSVTQRLYPTPAHRAPEPSGVEGGQAGPAGMTITRGPRLPPCPHWHPRPRPPVVDNHCQQLPGQPD